MWDQCIECGRKLPVEDLLEIGSDDNGGELFAIYLCGVCAERHEIENYWLDVAREELGPS